MEYQKKSQKFPKIHKKIFRDGYKWNDKEMPKEIPKERYTSPEERQKIIDNLRSLIIV